MARDLEHRCRGAHIVRTLLQSIPLCDCADANDERITPAKGYAISFPNSGVSVELCRRCAVLLATRILELEVG